MNSYDISIPLGETRNIAARGSYFKYLSGSAGGLDDTIRVVKQGTGESVQLRPGQGVRFDGESSEWFVKNEGGAEITGIVLIGSASFEDSRISGEVSVVDGGKARSSAGIAFIGQMYSGAAVGMHSKVQLFNPAGSGKLLVVEAFLASSQVAGAVSLKRNTAALPSPGITTPQAKKVGAAAGVGQFWVDAAAAVGDSILWGGFVVANQQTVYSLREPIVIEPGRGIYFQHGVANADMSAVFEWYEENQ